MRKIDGVWKVYARHNWAWYSFAMQAPRMDWYFDDFKTRRAAK